MGLLVSGTGACGATGGGAAGDGGGGFGRVTDASPWIKRVTNGAEINGVAVTGGDTGAGVFVTVTGAGVSVTVTGGEGGDVMIKGGIITTRVGGGGVGVGVVNADTPTGATGITCGAG